MGGLGVRRRAPVLLAAVVLPLAPITSQAASGWQPEHRHRVVAPGVEVGAHHFVDWTGVISGGRRSRDTYRNLSAVHVQLDSEPIVGWTGTVLFAEGYVLVGRDGSVDAGDVQVYSNLDSPSLAQLASLWVEHNFSDALRVKVGKQDANTEFSSLPSAGDFMHSSAGFSPTVVGFPSYPDPAMGLNVFYSRERTPESVGFDLRLGVYDGATVEGAPTGPRGPKTFFDDERSDAYFLVAEGGVRWDGGLASVGLWHYTARLPRFDGGVESGTDGIYAIGEQRVYSEPGDPNGEQGLTILGLWGWADEDVSPFAAHYSLGAYAVGPIPGRDQDTAGFYVSHVELTGRSAAGLGADETAFELFYRARVTPHLYVQPVLQYIRNPGAAPGIEDAFLATLRLEFRW